MYKTDIHIESLTTEVFNEQSLSASIIFSVPRFPNLVNDQTITPVQKSLFKIGDNFMGKLTFLPRGTVARGKKISLFIALTTREGYQFDPTIETAILNNNNDKCFRTEGRWAISEGANIKDLLDAEYLREGALRIQVDFKIDYILEQNIEIREARKQFRWLMQWDAFGDVIVEIQRVFRFYVHRDVLCKHHQGIRVTPVVFEDQRPKYSLPDMDPYQFERFMIDAYLVQTKYGRAHRG